jgi:hypothetical protein
MHTVMTVLFVLQLAFSANLQGRVYVAGTHDPVPLTRVRLERLRLTILELHARDGRFQFRDLLPGRYTIVVDSPGYETSYSELSLPDDWFTMIELRPKEAPQPGSTQPHAAGGTLRRILHKLFP